MDLKVDIDPEAVNKMVTDAILESAIGTTLREVVGKKVKELSQSYNNPIEKAVEAEVGRICYAMVHETFRPVIEAKVKESMTDELLSKIVDKAWNSFIRSLDR